METETIEKVSLENLILEISQVSEIKFTTLKQTNKLFVSVFINNSSVWFYKTGDNLLDLVKQCKEELIKMRILDSKIFQSHITRVS